MTMKKITLNTLYLLAGLSHASWSPPPEYALYPSDNGHFFQLSDGSPFFWQADTAWTLMTRLNYTETEQYLADRASKGFNVIEAIGPSSDGLDGKNRHGDLAFIDMDVRQPNEAYWKYVDSVVKLAWTRHGIRIALFPAWGNYVHNSENVAGPLNTSNAGVLGEFIGRRYPYLPKILFGDINPTWRNKTQVKAEYAAGGVPSEEYETIDWLPVYDALAEGIIRGEKAVTGDRTDIAEYTPLISLHNQNQWFSGAPVALASSEAGHRDWLTFDIAQSGHSDYPPNPPINWWNCRRGYETVELMYAVGATRPGKKRPALDNEPHYEGRYNNARDWLPAWNASDVRVGTWQTVFSGAAGAVYGADMVWQMYNPSLSESNGGGPSMPWYEAIKLPGSEQIQFVKKAVLDRGNGSFFDRIPAPDILVGHAGSPRFKGSWIMVYTPTGKPFSVDTKDIRDCDVKARWCDPLSGHYSKIPHTQCKGNTTIREFRPPKADVHDDWTLVLESGKS